MRELTRVEADQTAGGALGVVFLVAVGGGIVVSYAYEKLGGLEGIKRGIKRVADTITGSEREPE
ncbi:MAG: hypothetical protein OXI90_08500 [Gammaproteobacteria bacterium]|nr:hypothetical protein [Gammaproteobacteria bacterium]